MRIRRIGSVVAAWSLVATVLVIASAGATASAAPTGQPERGDPLPPTIIREADDPPAPPATDPPSMPGADSDPAPETEPESEAEREQALAVAPQSNTDFTFDFDAEVPPSFRTVFEAAGGLWSEVLDVRVPIHVEVSYDPLEPGVLGGARATSTFSGAGLPREGIRYAVAQANQFAGRDLDPAAPDIDVVVSSNFDFYLGLDANVPDNKIALLSLAMHELAHGLGHSTGLNQDLLSFPAGPPTAYDSTVVDGAGRPITTLPSSALPDAVRSNNLRWSGPRARVFAGSAPKLYAPSPFLRGSSVSHLDEDLFGSQLMTPFLGYGEPQLAVPDLTAAMLADIDWPLEGGRLPAPCSVGCAASAGIGVARPQGGGLSWLLNGRQFSYGIATDQVVTGDWDGNGTVTPGIVRRTGGQLYWYLRNSSTSGNADLTFVYGRAEDQAVVGDWNGDGRTTPGIVRRTGTQLYWYERDTNTSGNADRSFVYGLASDHAVAGDWNRDSRTTPGIVRRTGTQLYWYERDTNTSGNADRAFVYGRADDIAVAGDWNADGRTTPGIVRPGPLDALVWYLRNSNDSGTANNSTWFGLIPARPVAARR